jgi:hypothetical protein
VNCRPKRRREARYVVLHSSLLHETSSALARSAIPRFASEMLDLILSARANVQAAASRSRNPIRPTAGRGLIWILRGTGIGLVATIFSPQTSAWYECPMAAATLMILYGVVCQIASPQANAARSRL